MEKRYQVFVSSTYADLKEERQKVLQTLMEMDCIPSGMEMFPAADEEQWEFIKKVIDDCDYYLLIIGGRYGSTTDEGISYTEKEYDYAVRKGIRVIAFLHQTPEEIPVSKSELSSELLGKLDEFRNKVATGRLVKFWKSANELPGLVALSLTKTMKASPAIGWVRTDSIASEKATRKILELQEEILVLREQLASAKHTAPEGSELLAQGDDEFEVKLKVNFSNRSLGYHDPNKNYANEYFVTSSWNELFGAIGTLASQPVRETKIKSELARFLKEKFSDQLNEECGEGCSITSSSIGETIFQTIKYQFSALGLISSTQEVKLQRDTEREFVFCELTPLGRKKLMKVRAIYRAPEPNKSRQKDILTRASA